MPLADGGRVTVQYTRNNQREQCPVLGKSLWTEPQTYGLLSHLLFFEENDDPISPFLAGRPGRNKLKMDGLLVRFRRSRSDQDLQAPSHILGVVLCLLYSYLATNKLLRL